MTAIILILIGLGVGYWLGRRAGAGSLPASGAGGLAQTNEARRVAREQALARVRALFTDGANVTNDEVQKSLGVSDSAATDYLSTLEAQGVIEQVGQDGRFVTYRLK